VLWIVGIAIFMGANGSLGAVYAGRFIAGLGVGQTVVVGPVYLAEIVREYPLSPRQSMGLP
jgi:MFS family permease